MSKKRNPKAEREQRARFERHNNQRAAAAAATHARSARAAAELGMRPVALPSLADELDEADPRVRGLIRTTNGPSGADLERNLLGKIVVVKPFQPSLVREKEPMTQPYVSPNRITLRRVETINPKTGKKTGAYGLRGFKLPPDVVRRLIDRIDGLVCEVELNDDGILVRPASAYSNNLVSLPAWVPNKKI